MPPTANRLRAYLPPQAVQPSGSIASFISRIIEADPITVFAIATQSEAIGSIGLMVGKDVHRYTAEMGYWLAEPFWGKGIMTQAVKSMTSYAIRNLKLHRIYAEPYSTNPASVKVLEKAGFRCEGLLRSNVFKDGKVLDQFLYSYVGKASLNFNVDRSS
jgi:ribosomal-protein-alanine N-acetyltransferase